MPLTLPYGNLTNVHVLLQAAWVLQESEEEQGRRKSKTEDSAMKPGTDVLEDSPVRAPSTQEPPPDQEPSPARSAAQLDTDPIDPKTPDRPITRR